MKKLILFLLLTSAVSFGQIPTGTLRTGKIQMSTPNLGAKKDSVVVWDGTTKILRYIPRGVFLDGVLGGATDLGTTASPIGVTVSSSTGTDAVLPLVTSVNAGLQPPADKIKLNSIATGATANDTDTNLKNRANHTGVQTILTVTGLQPALDSKENMANKVNNFSIINSALYPSVPAVKTELDTRINGTDGTIPIYTGTNSIGSSTLYQTSEGLRLGSQKTVYGYGLSVSKLITTLNRHTFDDYSLLQPTVGGFGYGVFDASTEMSGSVANDHFIGFQSRINYSSSATMLTGLYSQLTGLLVRHTISGTGTIPLSIGVRVDNLMGTGPVQEVKGLFIENLVRGSVSNMGLDVRTTKNYVKTLDTEYLLSDSGSSAYINAFFKSSFTTGGKFYSAIAFGKSLATNNAAALGYIQNPSGISYAYVSPYGSAEGNQFAVSQNGKVCIGGMNDDTVNPLQVTGTARISSLAGSGVRPLAADPNGVVVVGDSQSSNGVYVPSYTTGTNVTSVTNESARYVVSGKVVTLYFSCILTVTTPANSSNFTVSLPVTGISTSMSFVGGCSSVTGPTYSSCSLSSSTNSAATIAFKHLNGTNTTISVSGIVSYTTL
jgi:hypothetical protein